MPANPNTWKIPWSGRSHDYTEEEIQFVNEVIRTADPMTQGKYLKQFEQNLTSYLNIPANHIFAVNSATSALELIATLAHLQEGDEVVLPAHTFTASALPFLRRKGKLIWADIDPETWVIDWSDVQQKITSRTKVIVMVHLYGLPADVGAFNQGCEGKDIILVEDAAQSFGASYKDNKAGTLADFGAFSFHGQKNLTTFGEGGAIYVKDHKLAEKIPSLRSFGAKPFANQEFYWKPAMSNVTSVIDWELPYKFTMGEIDCAIGFKLLERVDKLNLMRKKRYWQFREALFGFPELAFQKVSPACEPSYHLVPAKYDAKRHGIRASRDDLISTLAFQYGIQAIVQYCPLYRYELYQQWGAGQANCPATEDVFDNMVSFPFHVWMSDEDFQYMIDSTIKALKELRKEGAK
jgi:dTDP-4-amino-4,6-dideoxygalactose transaminase